MSNNIKSRIKWKFRVNVSYLNECIQILCLFQAERKQSVRDYIDLRDVTDLRRTYSERGLRVWVLHPYHDLRSLFLAQKDWEKVYEKRVFI